MPLEYKLAITFETNFGNGTLFCFVIILIDFNIGPSTLRLTTSSLKTCLLHGFGYLLNTALPTWSHLYL